MPKKNGDRSPLIFLGSPVSQVLYPGEPGPLSFI